MIKKTVTLTCDRCGAEIRENEHYYVEEVTLFPRLWDGSSETILPDVEPEEKERDLCEDCYRELHHCTLEPVELEYEPVEDVPVAEGETVTLPMPDEEPITVEVPVLPTFEPGMIAEDVATGEPVELDPEDQRIKDAVAEIVAMKPKGKRGGKPKLTEEQRLDIIEKWQNGVSQTKLAQMFDVSANTIHYVITKWAEARDGR